MESLITEDRRITGDEIPEHLGIFHGAAHHIITGDLAMTKVSAGWVPRHLDDAEMEIRSDACRPLLIHHQADPDNLLSRAVTMGESRILLYKP